MFLIISAPYKSLFEHVVVEPKTSKHLVLKLKTFSESLIKLTIPMILEDDFPY